MDPSTTSEHTTSTLNSGEGSTEAKGLTRSGASVESQDLAMDGDLEKQLQGYGDRSTATGSAEKGATSAGVQSSSPLPATLAHDDPVNPRNWSMGKKVLVNFILCIWVLSLTFSSTAWVGSIRALERKYDMSGEVAILGVTFVVLGFAAGPLLFGPSSELFGRRAVYVFCGIFYSAFSFLVAFAPNAPSLLIGRFFVGFFGGAPINNVPASIGDYTTPVQRGPFSILYALMAFGGPSLGPLCSTFIFRDAGSDWNLRVMAIFSTVMSLLAAFVPETHGPTLLKWKIKREGNAPPSLTASQVVGVYKVALARPFVYMITQPIVTLVCIYLSFLYGILYGFFQAFGVVWLEIRGFQPTSYGLTYISLGLGFLVAAVLLATVANFAYRKAATLAAEQGVKTPPEARLTLAYPAAVMTPISLFLFAWTAPYTSIHWAVPCLAELLFGVCIMSIFTAMIPYLVDNYLSTAASALAAGMASRSLIGSVFPLFCLQMYHRLTVQGATSLFAGIAVLLAPIPWIFRKYGPALRARSHYAEG